MSRYAAVPNFSYLPPGALQQELMDMKAEGGSIFLWYGEREEREEPRK